MRERLARALPPAGGERAGESSERDRRDRVSGHKTLLSLVDRAAEGPTGLRLRQEVLR